MNGLNAGYLLANLGSGFTTVEAAFVALNGAINWNILDMPSDAPAPWGGLRKAAQAPAMPMAPPLAPPPPNMRIKVPLSWGVKNGEVLIAVNYSAPVLVRVVEVHDTPRIDEGSDGHTWAVQKVDWSFYEDRLRIEKDGIAAIQQAEREHQREELRKKMLEYLPENSDVRRFAQIAAFGALDSPDVYDKPRHTVRTDKISDATITKDRAGLPGVHQVETKRPSSTERPPKPKAEDKDELTPPWEAPPKSWVGQPHGDFDKATPK